MRSAPSTTAGSAPAIRLFARATRAARNSAQWSWSDDRQCRRCLSVDWGAAGSTAEQRWSREGDVERHAPPAERRYGQVPATASRADSAGPGCGREKPGRGPGPVEVPSSACGASPEPSSAIEGTVIPASLPADAGADPGRRDERDAPSRHVAAPATRAGAAMARREIPRERKNPGDDLFSRKAALSVSSALESLTSVFGMGTGMASPPVSPGFVASGCCSAASVRGPPRRPTRAPFCIYRSSMSSQSWTDHDGPSH